MSRLFIGLELPDEVKSRLLQVRGEVTGARWQAREQLHLTLSFIGNVDDALERAIPRVLAGLAMAPFQAAVAGVGRFGTLRRPRALWAGMEPEVALTALHSQVTERLASLGLKPENRGFRPHVTLARLQPGATGTDIFLEAHRALSSPFFPVTQVSLFSSVTGEGGSRYEVIDRFGLEA